MANLDKRDHVTPERRSHTNRNILTAVGMVAVLGVASLSAYLMSGDTPVKPASGAAQAMSLATTPPAETTANVAAR